jgi:hypothetical protein
MLEACGGAMGEIRFGPISVHKWMLKNPKSVFFYQEHLLMLLSLSTQNDIPFIIGSQIEWQLAMMAKFGYNDVLSIDATLWN